MTFRESTQRLKVSCAVVAVGAISLILTGAVSAQEYTARLSVHWEPTHHSAIHAKMFADEVNKRADGRLRIDYFPSGQLFGVREQLGAVTSGAIEMGGIVGVVSFPPINKNFNVVSITGMFDSYGEQRAFFQDDPTGKAVWDDITKKSDTVLLMYDPVGPVMTFSDTGIEWREVDVRLKGSGLDRGRAADVGGTWRQHGVHADGGGLFWSSNRYDRHDQQPSRFHPRVQLVGIPYSWSKAIPILRGCLHHGEQDMVQRAPSGLAAIADQRGPRGRPNID